MKRKSLEFNQIEYVNQFVDPSVDEAVRAFHLSTLSPACSPLENLVALAPVDATELANVEFYSARFSHLSRICEPVLPSLTKVSRPVSLKKGTKGRKISLMQLFAGITNIFGADAALRRHYPSGGALYSIETLIITGQDVEDTPAGSIYHYIASSGEMEILPHRIESADFDKITSIKDALFYILYVINLPKSLFKYRHRGYRLGLMEAGSMYQLAAMEFNKINLSNRVLAGFSEYDITCRCGLDPRTFLPLVIQAFGYEQED